MCGIYKITNILNGKVYIGQSNDIHKRFIKHKSLLKSNRCHNKHLQRSWNLYGESNFVFDIVEECDVLLLDEREVYWISYYNSRHNGYNQTDGGGGVRGYKPSREVIEKRKAALTGKKKTPEHIENMRIAQKRYYATHMSKSSIKIVCLNTGDVFDNAAKAEEFSHYNRMGIRSCCRGECLFAGEVNGEKAVWANYTDYIKMSDDEIWSRIMVANMPYRYEMSDDWKKKISGALTGKKRALKASENIRKSENVSKDTNGPRSKKVVCLNTREIFDSAIKAKEKYGMKTNTGIRACCRGELKSCGEQDGQRLAWAEYNDYIGMSDEEIDALIQYANMPLDRELNPNAKSVLCVTTGEVFGCITDACEKYNVNINSIVGCCKGKRKHAGGMEWQYYSA